MLLEKEGVDPDSKDFHYGQTPLMWAAAHGHEAVARLLLHKDRVNINSKDSYGRTPLSYAAANGNEAMVKLLMTIGADKDSMDAHGRTPLSWAARRGKEAVVELLLTKGADADYNDIVEFQYQPLTLNSPNFKTIRVLGLYPGNNEDEIECCIIEDFLPPDDKRGYEALSYCWGDASDRVAITVNDARLNVTKNLHAALRRLRFEDEIRWIWADAVCINQGDPVEKSEQVQMMREIYQHASRTLVWLGEGSEHTTRGFALISRLLKSLELKAQAKDYRSFLEFNGEGRAFYDLPPPYAPEWRGFYAIFDVPYFTRVWVIQEVAVSSSVEVFCGSDSVSWNDLIWAVLTCIAFRLGAVYDTTNSRLSLIINAAHTTAHSGQEWNMLDLLDEYRSSCATDPRDKVYALLGLMGPAKLP
jgi:hypothetical protein